MNQKPFSLISTLVVTIILACSSILVSRQLHQPTQIISKAAGITTTGYIPPILTASQKSTAANLTRLYDSLPVSQPTFKITFDYRQDKYLVTYIGNIALAQTYFQTWLTANNYSSLYPVYFTLKTSAPVPTPSPTRIPTPTKVPAPSPTRIPTPTPLLKATLTPGVCTGKIPICVDCVQCKSGVWTCAPCSASY